MNYRGLLQEKYGTLWPLSEGTQLKQDTVTRLFTYFFYFKGLVSVYNFPFWKIYCKYSITQPLASANSFSPEMISL